MTNDVNRSEYGRCGQKAESEIIHHVPMSSSSDKTTITIEDAIERLGMGSFQSRLLWAAGLCFAADAMEISLLTFLSVVLKAEWGLTDTQMSSITSVVFTGAVLGSLILGRLGDKVGRKPIFVVTAIIIAFFGLLTAAATNYTSLIWIRLFVGFGVGGLTVPFDTYSEFLPVQHRGSQLMVIEYFWSFGTILVPILAYFTLGQFEVDNIGPLSVASWRVFVLVCSIPCIVSSILAVIYVPESPRWLISEGHQQKAISILRLAATKNGKDPMELFPQDIYIIDDHHGGIHHHNQEKSSFLDLLAPNWRCLTLNLWCLWLTAITTYWGIVITVTLIFSSTEYGGEDNSIDKHYSFDYGAIFVAAFSEVVGVAVAITTIDRAGRIPTTCYSLVTAGVTTFMLCWFASFNWNRRIALAYLVVLAFLGRMSGMISSSVVWVSTAEILPTEIRSTGHSAANAIGRIGGIISPFLASPSNSLPNIGATFMTISFIATIAAYNTPETRGKALGSVLDDHEEDNMEKNVYTVKNNSQQAIDTVELI